MLRSCGHCGKLHKYNEPCPKKKPKELSAPKKDTKSNKFRKTYKWTQKSIEIRKRDNHICQLCLRGFEGTVKKYNSENIQAHHIESLESAYDERLDNLNLLAVCKRHHDMAEDGYISKSELKNIAKEQEDKYVDQTPPLM